MPRSDGATRGIRLTDVTWRAWKFWLNQQGMTYEEGIRFLLDRHPVELKVPEGVRITKRKGEG